jgi:hypothetical protein
MMTFQSLGKALNRAGCTNPIMHMRRLRQLALGMRVPLSYHSDCRVLVGDVYRYQR